MKLQRGVGYVLIRLEKTAAQSFFHRRLFYLYRFLPGYAVRRLQRFFKHRGILQSVFSNFENLPDRRVFFRIVYRAVERILTAFLR